MAIGTQAYNASDTENDNIAIGYRAMYANTAGGVRNIAIGNYAGDSITSADDNTLVGHTAGSAITTGVANTFIGQEAGLLTVGGTSNTAVGNLALRNNAATSDNVAIGRSALAANIVDNNTAVGRSSLTANTTGAGNTALGWKAGEANTTGGRNVYIGYQAGLVNTTSSNNVAIGQDAHLASASGAENVIIGTFAAKRSNGASNNIALGYAAGEYMTNGHSNICIGTNAGVTTTQLTTGDHNMFIGRGAHGPDADSSNSFAFGYAVGGSNSTFTFGSGGTDSRIAFGETSISAPSDVRYKKNIEDATAGLSFINDLRPVTFEWKNEGDLPVDHVSYVEGSTKRTMNDNVNHGFIAQEVKSTIDSHSEIKNGYGMWSEDPIDGRQRLADGALVPMLVKSIQELSAKNDALLARIETLEG